MSQQESRLSLRIVQALNRQPYTFAWKVHATGGTVVGLPDIICCSHGAFAGFETKLPGRERRTSPRQKLVHSRIRAAMGGCWVVSSPEEALERLEQFLQHQLAATTPAVVRSRPDAPEPSSDSKHDEELRWIGEMRW